MTFLLDPEFIKAEQERRHEVHSDRDWRSQEIWRFDKWADAPEAWPWLDIGREQLAAQQPGLLTIVPKFLDLVQGLLDMTRDPSTGEAVPLARKCVPTGPLHRGCLSVDLGCSGVVAWRVVSVAGAIGFKGCIVMKKHVHLDAIPAGGEFVRPYFAIREI